MSLVVVDPGALTTVQDHGRPGLAHLGVPRAGVLDRPAAELANRVLANAPDAAVLETTVTGCTLRTEAAHWLVVTGARCSVTVDGDAEPHGQAFFAPAGSDVVVGPAVSGVRSYLAVRGGIDVEPVLGSRSTDTLAWVGPPRLEVGQVLPVGTPAGEPADHETPRPPEPGALRLVEGPRADWFGPGAVAALCASPYTVGEASNRIGLRLAGPALRRVREDELPSEGMVLGAVQVPPDGQPVVFLADHPVTGGYPVVAVVQPEDLWQCAQLRPGDRVRFRAARQSRG